MVDRYLTAGSLSELGSSQRHQSTGTVLGDPAPFMDLGLKCRFNEQHKAWFYVNTKGDGGPKSQWTQ